ncbi:hypothetical protein DM01DRAFT_1333020 [Hesseltinella vesiculosa]|uniref:Uncharacterized protein n=1 Tax=Hesseltinella vesiculosa TaxID=101127 RepID=A0A1X2GR52_9FUNG|nr:hypothetical protein DM01DRAFT_1333020 [Hesseltinella vesiculosa]
MTPRQDTTTPRAIHRKHHDTKTRHCNTKTRQRNTRRDISAQHQQAQHLAEVTIRG